MDNSRFDLEQSILDVWGIVDDLKLFREILDSEEFIGMSASHTDKVDNYLLALITIYQYKFDKTFNLYEKTLEVQNNVK